MAEKTRHPATGMVFSQPISGEHERKTRIARRRETIFHTCKPIHHRIRVARIECVMHRGFERLVMGRERPVLQTFGNEKPAKPVLVQNERRIPTLTIEAALSILRLVIGTLVFLEIGNVEAGPSFRTPPDEFFPFAPWFAVRLRAGAIINYPPIARPTEPPAVTEIIFRFARVRLIHAVAGKNAGVNPATTCG